MPEKVYAIISPTGSTGAASEYALEFDDEKHGDASTFAPGDDIYMLFQSRLGPYISGIGSDGVQLINLGAVTRKRTQAGLTLNHDTREINLTYIPDGVPEVVFFGNSVSLDQSRLKGGVISPVDYDGSQPVTLNVIYNTIFQSLKHVPFIPALTSTDDGGILHGDYEGSGELASYPLAYQVEYGG